MSYLRPGMLGAMALVCALIAGSCSASALAEGHPAHASDLVPWDQYTLVGPKSLLSGYEPQGPEGNINVVVEIPTGTIDKWEVDKETGGLKWEFKKGGPRVVNYLGYPGNYGMIPRTLLPKGQGGDGDPLDVIVLGPAVPRGEVLQARLIGVLKLLDSSEQDDKLIAVIPGVPMGEVASIEELRSRYKGVMTILAAWFANYKGSGKMEVTGFGDESEARSVLDMAIKAYAQQAKTNQ